MSLFRCIAVASPSFSKNPQLLSELRPLCEKIVVNSGLVKWQMNTLVAWITSNEADCVVIGTEIFDKDIIDQLPGLKAVGKYGVGYDNVDTAYLASKKIFFGWKPGVNRRSVTELALGFMLGHCRNIFYSVSRMQEGIWHKDGGVELSQRTIGIVGLGNVGGDLARLLKLMGCRVVFFDIADKSDIARDLDLESLTYEELLRVSDIISFHVPGGDATRHLFGTAELATTKANLLVINTSRGSVVDFDATISAVKNRSISAFACDVFESEPFSSTHYTVQDGFYFTSHIGANTAEAVLAMGRAVIAELSWFLHHNPFD